MGQLGPPDHSFAFPRLQDGLLHGHGQLVRDRGERHRDLRVLVPGGPVHRGHAAQGYATCHTATLPPTHMADRGSLQEENDLPGTYPQVPRKKVRGRLHI